VADEPSPEGPAVPLDDAPDAFFGMPEPDPSDFWEEVEARHSGKARRRRHRAAGRTTATAATATAAPAASTSSTSTSSKIPGSGIRSRVAAAWAAEASARRALRDRKAGTTGPPPSGRRHRKAAAAIVGGLALVALALAVTEANWRDAASTDSAEATAASTDGSGASPASDGSSLDDQTADPVVESQIVDAPRPESTKTTSRARAKTTTTTSAPRSVGADPAGPSLPTPGSSGPPAPKPATPAPTTPAPTTATPATTAPPTPATTAPRPPAVPTVQVFTAKAATSAGGACPPLQWATTFTWATANASSVTISGLLETTQANLPGDGSRVVCRLLPGGPLGGWTLTATGPGGTATASA
jgi:hypothetical protein